MSREASAWMPLYVGDYLKDTARLTTEQHGAYLLLILDYWSNGAPPDDDAVLQNIAKLDKAGWKRVRPALARMFRIDAGEWRHKRIEAELDNAAANAERRSNKAKAAAEARWGQSQKGATGNAPSMPQASTGHGPSNAPECPPQSHSPEEKSSEAYASGAEAPKASPIDLKAAVFSAGVALLTSTGSTDATARAMIGKWKQSYRDADILDALSVAQAEGTPNPIALITATLGARNGKRTSPRRDDTDYRDPLLGEYLARNGAVGGADHG